MSTPAGRGPSGLPPTTPGTSTCPGAVAVRPLSRVEQMLHAYYDLEDTPEREAAHEQPPGSLQQEIGGPQDSADAGSSQLPAEAREEPASNVLGTPAGIQGGGGALKTALQLLTDIPYLQQSVSSAVSGGGVRSEPPLPSALDLNSPEFNMQAFFSTAVRSCTLRQLLRLSNELEGEVRVLERDIQTLVYENYGKFLSATETVRRVRQAMSDVEAQLQTLSTSVASIEKSSGQLMTTVHERAAGIEDLVAFRQLIEQLQVLSTLPELLRRHLLANDPERALLIYEHARIFLAEQQAPCPHLQRLALLRRDAESAATYARKLLRQRLDVPAREAHADGNGSFRHAAVPSCGKDIQERSTSDRRSRWEDPSLDGQPEEHPLSSADASRVMRLLLRSGEDPRELLRLYQRGRRHAAFLELQRCFAREPPRAPPGSGEEHAQLSPAEASVVQEVSAATTGLTLELACSRLSAQYVDLLAVALRDILFLFRFISAIKAQELPCGNVKDSPEASDVRRVRAAIEAAERRDVAIDAEGETSLLSFLSSLVESAFSRLSAMIASAVPVAVSVVRGTSSVVSAFESSWQPFLPPALQQQATEAARGAQRKVLLEATALAFKRAYAKVAQELHDAIATAVEHQQQQQEQDEDTAAREACSATSRASRRQGPSALALAELAVMVTRQHPAEQSAVVEGCVALTDAQQLLQGACWPASGEVEALVRRHTTPWIAGLFELFIRLAARLTKDVPAAFAGYPEVLEDALCGSAPTERQPLSSSQESWLTMQVEASLISALACQHPKRETSVDQLHPGSLPLISLVYLRFGRSLQQLGLAKLEAIGTELFPSLDAGWLCGGRRNVAATPPADSGGSQRKSLPVASRLRAATQSLMTAYVFCCGQDAAQSTVLSLAEYHRVQLQEAGGKEHKSRPPGRPSKSLAPLLGALRHCDHELSILMEETAQPPSALAQLPGAEPPQQVHRRLGRPFGRRRTAIEREMERLFARKQRVFSSVPFSRTKAVMGVFRIVARAILEFVRGRYFDVRATQQLQVDCAAASWAIRELVQPEDASVVDGFFDEIVTSAALRCIGLQVARTENSLEPSAILLPDGDIDSILSAERNSAASLNQPH